VKQQLTTSHDSMIVGLQIFIEKKEMALDSNFWCGCPENIQNQCFFL